MDIRRNHQICDFRQPPQGRTDLLRCLRFGGTHKLRRDWQFGDVLCRSKQAVARSVIGKPKCVWLVEPLRIATQRADAGLVRFQAHTKFLVVGCKRCPNGIGELGAEDGRARALVMQIKAQRTQAHTFQPLLDNVERGALLSDEEHFLPLRDRVSKQIGNRL